MGKTDTVALTIDGVPVKAKKGKKVLWAALDAGIYIPNLCAIREAEEPFGGCRLCFVEVEGKPEPVTSCTEPVAEGMAVHTNTPRVNRLRRTALELIVTSTTADCRACPKNRRCEFQRTASWLGAKLKPQRFRKKFRALPVDASNPFFVRDPNRCIVCGKCVWACSERVGADAIDFTFRGVETVPRWFDIGPQIDSRCESCGECVAICPVGALLPKGFQWAEKEVKTICGHCGVGCGIYLGINNNRVASVRGDEQSPVNRGSLCAKGRYGIAEWVHHPERLTSPLVRQNDRFTEASWEEAVEFVASRFAKYKGDEFAIISSAQCTNEDSYVIQKFARVVMGTNNVDHSSRLCDAPSIAGLSQSFGSGAMSNPVTDIDGAACIFAIGTNTTRSHPIVGQHVRRAARRGAKLIVVNPREIDLCRHASLWLRNRPGSDLALLMGIMSVIVDAGLADWPFIRERCENFEAFRESLRDFDLEFVEKVTGVPQQLVIEAARTYAINKPAAILYASGITQHVHGTDNVLAIANLAMLTGNIGKASSGANPLKGQNNTQGASDMGVLPDFFPGYQPVADPEVREKFETAWECSLNPSPGLSLSEIIQAVEQGKIKALYIIGTNPLLTMTNARWVKSSLKKLEFLVAQDLFLSETARLAHVVLPAASFAEKDGTFTNTERRVQRVRRAIAPVGNSKPDWWIVGQIARKLGARGFDFANSSQIMGEISRLTPSYGGISMRRLARKGLQCPCPSQDHPGTPVLHTQAFIRGKGRFAVLKYQPPAELPDEEYPLVLTGERSLYQFGNLSTKVSGLDLLRGEEVVEINPQDAIGLGVSDNEVVRVVSRRGEITTTTKLTHASSAGVVCMSPPIAELPTNILTGSTVDTVSKTPELKVCAVRVEKSHNRRG